jgi:hypothetical protein
LLGIKSGKISLIFNEEINQFKYKKRLLFWIGNALSNVIWKKLMAKKLKEKKLISKIFLLFLHQVFSNKKFPKQID